MKDKFCTKAETPALYHMLEKVAKQSTCRWHGTGYSPAKDVPYPKGLNPHAKYIAVDAKGYLYYFAYVDKSMKEVDADTFVERCVDAGDGTWERLPK